MKPYLLPLAIASVVIAATGALGYAIWQNHQNRKDINRIIRPSPNQAREGIDRAIAQLTPAQAAAIFRKLSPELRAQLRGSPGRRGPRGPRGAPGRSGSRGSAGQTGRSGSSGRQGAPGRSLTAPRQTPPRSPAQPPRAPTPRPPLVPKVPAPFPPQGGTSPNGKPCPPRNPTC